MSTNYSGDVQAARSARRQRFAAFITPYIDAHGGPKEVAKRLGVKHPRTVADWVAAKNIPTAPRLLALAELFDIDPHVMLDTAGKPPIVELRHAMADDHAATLPGILKDFQARMGLDGPAAAAHFGVDRFTYARIAAGSARPTSLEYCARFAHGLGLSITEVLDAAQFGPHSKLRKELERGSTGIAGMIRDTAAAAGIRPWSADEVRRTAKLLAIPVTRMKGYLAGHRTPDLLDCQRIADAGVHTLSELLEASGYDTDEAARLAGAVTAARNTRLSKNQTRRRDSYVSVGELIKAYRITAGLSQDDVANRVGVSRTAVTKVELGETAGSLELLLELCSAIDVPLPRMLVSAGLVL